MSTKGGGNSVNTAKHKVKHIITATAPTSYQTSSLRAFNIGCKKNANGSYSGYEVFPDEESAMNFLAERAEKYNDEDPEGTPEKLAEMIEDIASWRLTLDAVTAHIEELNEENQD